MANKEQLELLWQGVGAWNTWREEHRHIEMDLSEAKLIGTHLEKADLRGTNLHEAILYQAYLQEANLQGANLNGADLRGANLHRSKLVGVNLQGAKLQGTNLQGADLRGANLRGANLRQTDLHRANLTGADLRAANLEEADLQRANLEKANLQRVNLQHAELIGAKLTRADLQRANLNGADLRGANLTEAILTDAYLIGAILTKVVLTRANLTRTNLEQATLIQATVDQTILAGSKVYGLSVWDINGTPQDQSSLIITPPDAPSVTVDDLEVAQFIYLLLNRAKLRNVINTITSKAVLIIGRFTPERKAVLDAMADELRRHNLLPIIFDFEGATTRDIAETIKTLAGLSLFVIADITNPKSAPLELQATVPDYQIPFVAIIQEGERPFSMFSDLPKYPWVLTPVIEYPSVEKLLQGFKQGIIDRAWAKHQELVKQKNKALETQSIEDFVWEDEG